MFTTGGTGKRGGEGAERKTEPFHRVVNFEWVPRSLHCGPTKGTPRFARDDNFAAGCMNPVELEVTPHPEKPRARHSRGRS
jgi:hypothetical protein